MSPFEYIKITGTPLNHGESERGVCPFCHGGRTGEQSFLVSRRGADITYTCFRASCGKWGVISATGAPERRDPFPERRGKVLRAPTFPLSDETAERLLRKFELTRQMLDYYRVTETAEGDVIIPVYSSTGAIQGHERKVRKPVRAKSVFYPTADTDGMGWYNTMPSYLKDCHAREFHADRLIIVEDAYSAMKCNVFMHSMALLGSWLPLTVAARLASMQYTQITLALDADATATAAKIRKRYRGVLPHLRVVQLIRDLKDTPFRLIRQMIGDPYGKHQR